MDELNKMQLDDTFVKMAQDAYLKSSKQRKKEIKGECYVSRSSDRQKKIETAKKVIYGLATAIALGSAVKIAGALDFEDAILDEVTKTSTNFNTNGKFVEEHIYDDSFVDAMIDLNTGELIKLYSDTSKEMKAEGSKEDAKIVSEVVGEMEENYLEEHGKTR